MVGTGSPRAVYGTPFYVLGEAGVLALDAETGERQWVHRLGFQPTSVGVADGTVVAGGRDAVAIVADATRRDDFGGVTAPARNPNP